MNRNKIELLYTNIGRGHPFYLDGFIEEMNRSGKVNLIKNQSDVFSESRGVSLFLWKLIRILYVKGAQDSIVSKVYRQLRNNRDYNKDSYLLRFLGKSLREKYTSGEHPLLVAHPLLLAILKGRKKMFYQHGELITPSEAVVQGAEIVFVPIAKAVDPFLTYYKRDQIIVTGLCIEPSLVKIAKDCYLERQNRFELRKPLVGGYFSSGAEPKQHIELLTQAIVSVVSSGGKAIVFAKNNGNFERKIEEMLHTREISYDKIDSSEGIPYEISSVTIVVFKNRREEYIFTTRFFNFLDYFMSPSHERSNWAAGLGLPLFMLEPSIGPFSPLNRDFLLETGTGYVVRNIEMATHFGEILSELYWQGKLTEMAQNGWQKEKIDGFKSIVTFFSNYLKEESL